MITTNNMNYGTISRLNFYVSEKISICGKIVHKEMDRKMMRLILVSRELTLSYCLKTPIFFGVIKIRI